MAGLHWSGGKRGVGLLCCQLYKCWKCGKVDVGGGNKGDRLEKIKTHAIWHWPHWVITWTLTSQYQTLQSLVETHSEDKLCPLLTPSGTLFQVHLLAIRDWRTSFTVNQSINPIYPGVPNHRITLMEISKKSYQARDFDRNIGMF